MATHARKKSSKPKTTIYEVAEHLRTPEETAAYLDAWLDEAPDDVSGIARALGDVWAAAGFEDTLLRWNRKPEVGYGNETAVQPGVQA